jgi:hypothetical protein
MEVRGQAVAPARAVGLYESGKLVECETLCRGLPPMQVAPWHLHALLALKRTKDAAEGASFRKLLDEPRFALAVCLGWELEGKSEEAARWRERAIKALDAEGRDSRRIATMLRSTQPPATDEVARFAFSSARQPLVYALLASKFPARRGEYLRAAAKYNVRRAPPYQLVKQAIEAGTPPKSPNTANR